MAKIQKVEIIIRVETDDGKTREHCTISHTPGEPTSIVYENGHSPEHELLTVGLLKAALHDCKMAVKRGQDVTAMLVPKNVH